MASLQRVALECSFSSWMNPQEIRSLHSQILRVYGQNKHHKTPLQIHLTGLCDLAPNSDTLPLTQHLSRWESDGLITLLQPKCEDVWAPDELLWLSPDAPQALEAPLHQYRDRVIVIGGLIDKSVKKGMTLRRATEHGIEARRLPVREHAQRKDLHPIMTLPAVFGLLHEVDGGATWSDAFGTMIPGRAIRRRELEEQRRLRQKPPSAELARGDAEGGSSS